MENLLKDCKFIAVSNAAAAAQTQINSNIVDISGYDGVCVVARLGVVTSGAVITLVVQDSGDNATTNMAVVGTNVTVTDAGAFSNTLLISDVVKIQKRYVRAIVTRGTQNAEVNGVTMILYNSKNKPVTADATVAGSGISEATS